MTQTETLVYDVVDNLTNIDYPVSPDMHSDYDALNRPTTMVNAVGSKAYSSAGGGQLRPEAGPWASDTCTKWP